MLVEDIIKMRLSVLLQWDSQIIDRFVLLFLKKAQLSDGHE